MRWLKDPNATLQYTLDWSEYLGSDTIVSAAWSAPGLTTNSTSSTTTTTTIWLSGGTVGKVYTVRCRVTTTAGTIDDRSFEIEVTNR